MFLNFLDNMQIIAIFKMVCIKKYNINSLEAIWFLIVFVIARNYEDLCFYLYLVLKISIDITFFV